MNGLLWTFISATIIINDVFPLNDSNSCFEQKYEKYQFFLSGKFHFFVIKISVYLNKHVFVMRSSSYYQLSFSCIRLKL